MNSARFAPVTVKQVETAKEVLPHVVCEDAKLLATSNAALRATCSVLQVSAVIAELAVILLPEGSGRRWTALQR